MRTSLRSYYETTQSQQLQAILPQLREIRDEASAKRILPESVDETIAVAVFPREVDLLLAALSELSPRRAGRAW